MEWPDLLRRYADALQEYTSWLDNGCVGEPPAAVDPTGVHGPVPAALRPYATELAGQVMTMERVVADRLAGLRSTAGHPAAVRKGYDVRPMPRYLDAMG